MTAEKIEARERPAVVGAIFISACVALYQIADTIKTSTYYVPGIVALGIISASFVNLVITITEQREQNILKRRRATDDCLGGDRRTAGL